MWAPIIVAVGVALFLAIVGGLMTPIGPWYRCGEPGRRDEPAGDHDAPAPTHPARSWHVLSD